MTSSRLHDLAAVILLTGVGCADPSFTNPGVSVANPTYSEDIGGLIERECSGCHGGDAAGGGGFSLDDAYYALVDVPSAYDELDYVEPGDPARSYLWRKLEGSQADVGDEGSSMPLGGALGEGDLANIKTWIEQGAVL